MAGGRTLNTPMNIVLGGQHLSLNIVLEETMVIRGGGGGTTVFVFSWFSPIHKNLHDLAGSFCH